MKPSATTLKYGPVREIVGHVEHFSAFGYMAAQLTCGHEQVYKVRSQRRIRCRTCRDEAALRDGSQEPKE